MDERLRARQQGVLLPAQDHGRPVALSPRLTDFLARCPGDGAGWPRANVGIACSSVGANVVIDYIESGAPLAYHHGNLREAVLERAAEIVAERGVEALSLRSLARDLGVSHAAPSRHFADRAALLRALAQTGFERSVEVMNDGADAAGADPVARYRALGRSYVRFAVEHPALFRAMNHPEVRAQMDEDLRDAHQVFFRTLREGVEEAQKAGWRPEADPDALVAFSIAGAMGTAELMADGQWRRALGTADPGSRERLADAVLDLIVEPSDAAPSATDEPHELHEPRTRSAG